MATRSAACRCPTSPCHCHLRRLEPAPPAHGGLGRDHPDAGLHLPVRPHRRRAATGDPRPAVAERYRDRADYLARLRIAAEALVAQRLMLAEDLDLAVALAAERYDALIGN